MADIADIAAEQEDLARQSALADAARAARSTKSPTATGRCLECDLSLIHI